MSAPWVPEPGLTRCTPPPRAVEARLDYRAWLSGVCAYDPEREREEGEAPRRGCPLPLPTAQAEKPAPTSFEVVGPCVVVVDFLEELRRLSYSPNAQSQAERYALSEVMYG